MKENEKYDIVDLLQMANSNLIDVQFILAQDKEYEELFNDCQKIIDAINILHKKIDDEVREEE